MATFDNHESGRLYRAAEYALYRYQQFKEQLEAYIDQSMRCTYRQKDEGSSSGFISDPTALGAMRLVDVPPEIETAEKWVWSIENAWGELEAYDPPKARLLEVYYGLNSRDGRSRGQATSAREAVQREFGIGKTTFYQWKDEAVRSVIYAGIQSGVLQPFKAKPPA